VSGYTCGTAKKFLYVLSCCDADLKNCGQRSYAALSQGATEAECVPVAGAAPQIIECTASQSSQTGIIAQLTARDSTDAPTAVSFHFVYTFVYAAATYCMCLALIASIQ
jgi:hypothetical protein